MSEAIDPINVIYKLQRLLDEGMDNNSQVLIGGGVDSMDKYNYILGKIHTLDQVKQELSNLLNPKEPDNDDDKVTRIRR
jgi:hypothetical protein|tara:strand:- start:1289 stop:1525 length:237 start_codon:yes stop_codon:yes gene_type:complete